MLFLLLLLSLPSIFSLSCRDESNNPISWFILLKYNNGGSYMYSDTNYPILNNSAFNLGDKKTGALAYTLLPIYNRANIPGYIMYNDDPNENTTVSSLYGHTKGVVGWDSKEGFWLIHSIPEFPASFKSGYNGVDPKQQIYGQSILCISMNYAGLSTVGNQLLYNRGYVYDYSEIIPPNTPTSLINVANGIYNNTASTKVEIITSTDGTQFLSLSKTGKWGKSLYPDLVAPTLKTALYVETWIRGLKIASSCSPTAYSVLNIQTLTFQSRSFSYTQDHSKWVVSQNKAIPAVCIGGINQMTSQNKRGGCTVCIQNTALWTSFISLITTVENC